MRANASDAFAPVMGRAASNRVARVAAICVILIIALICARWVLGWSLLRSLVPGQGDMNLVTCSAGLLGAIALLALSAGPSATKVVAALAMIVLALAGLEIVGYAAGVNNSAFDLMPPDRDGGAETVHAGRMPPIHRLLVRRTSASRDRPADGDGTPHRDRAVSADARNTRGSDGGRPDT